MKRKIIVFMAVLALLQFCCSSLWARPTTAYQAEKVVAGWLKADPQPLGAALGQEVIKVETFTDDNDEPIYHIVYLKPSGFVIVPADDLVEPIIGFADDGTYEPSPDNPLGALVTNDLNGRVATVRDIQRLQGQLLQWKRALNRQAKWDQLTGFAEALEGPVVMGLPSVSDLRVDPLVQSKWDQRTCCSSPALACYNYYTPPGLAGISSNYPCGCVATAMAQVMRYHQHPETCVYDVFDIKVNGVIQSRSLRGSGFCIGCTYEWNDMVLEPDCSTTMTQRHYIGMLCHDAGVAVSWGPDTYTNYKSNETISHICNVKDALINSFRYRRAVFGCNKIGDLYYNIGEGLNGMVNPNLDFGYPVILNLFPPPHTVVGDGYGYNSSTLYHHLNMGWAGTDDAWYNLPDFQTTNYHFTSVCGCTYNIFPSDPPGGPYPFSYPPAIISGRITTPTGEPIDNANVCLEGGTFSPCTNDKGIYASGWPSLCPCTITVSKSRYVFSPASQNVTTGYCIDGSATSGNRWGIDFVGFAGDFDGDGDIDLYDFAIFVSAWLTKPGETGWNPDCDISIPADNFIDMLDFAVFAQGWLVGK